MRSIAPRQYSVIFFFNDTATTEIYTLSLHDALPISAEMKAANGAGFRILTGIVTSPTLAAQIQSLLTLFPQAKRSEEHTSELQSQSNLVCRLLLEKKKVDQPLDHGQSQTRKRPSVQT